MNDYNDISRAILTGGDKVTLRRLGGKPIYAFDEGTRLLAVLHGQGVSVNPRVNQSESACAKYV